jgi:hypothetical protein
MNNGSFTLLQLLAQNSGVIQYIASRSVGAARHDFMSYGGTSTLFRILPSSAADVNFLQATGAAATASPSLSAIGNDTNISLGIKSKGSGSVHLYTNTSDEQVEIYPTTTAVNRFRLTGAIAGGYPVMSVAGTDPDIGMTFALKGAGAFHFSPSGGDALVISNVAGATRYVTIIGSNGGNPIIDVSAGALRLSGGTADIQWGKALIALGGGAAPTLGTIGGAGPATAAQNSWMRALDSAGNAFWVPAWK